MPPSDQQAEMLTCLFPTRSQPVVNTPGNAGGTVKLDLPSKHELLVFQKTHRLTVEQLVQAGWSAVLRRYTGSENVAFAVSSSTAVLDHAVFTCLIEESEPITTYLKNMNDYYHSQDGDSLKEVCIANINTGVCYYGSDGKGWSQGDSVSANIATQPPTLNKLALMVHADFRHHTPNLSLSYSAGIEAKIAQNVGSTLSKALTQLVSLDAESFMSMGELDLLSERDQQHLRSINHHYPVSIGSCVHDMISARAKISPHTEAIHSWDGSLTYKELDDLSARMAKYLCREFPHKIGPEMAIGICFEKSFAAVVSELAVLKTGSAFVPLDGGYPDDRLEVVSEIAEISLVLASPQYSARLEHHLKSVVCVPLSKSLLEAMLPSLQPDEIISSTSMATPEDAAFILFTSGSTGKPKAVVQPHQAICTLFQSHAESLHMDSSCRVFQFAAYTFDVSTMDIYTTLMQGGCLCIPSESDRRNNIAGFIKQARVNWADLTATVANLIYPQEVPTLKTLVLAGEAVQEEHLERWFGHVRLINCYGPVESGNCTAYEFRDRREKPAATIGREMGGARCWIVAPQNPDRLASVGEVGEILVEGPTLSRCYLKDPLRTQNCFVKNLKWSIDGRFTYPNYAGVRRFYRTGDMAYMDPDGFLVFVGRADQQVKVHGQRIELMEIEHHITSNSVSTISRAVVAYPRSGPFADQLVAVLQLDGTSSSTCLVGSRKVGPFRILDSLQIDLMLRSRLPGYMVPSLFLSIEQIMLTGSGKSDRKKIHDQLCCLPSEVKFASFGASNICPLSEDETVAIAISAFLADLLESSIILNQEVLLDRLGISSIQAIKLLSWLKSNYGGDLSIEHLSREGMSIRTLANTLHLAASGNLVPAVDLAREVKQFTESILLDLRQNSCSTPAYRESPAGSLSTVLLTGATGYLGIEIFRQVLEQPTVSLVHVLVQASSQEAGLERLLQALSAAGHKWEGAWERRVVVWPGDLSQPQLGLQNGHWEELTNGTINTIIHNGALVRYDLCYDRLKAVNVLATVRILQIMMYSSCAINFVYVSGGQRFNPAQELSEALRISQAAESTGYSQSKLVSELIVSRVADEFRKVRGHRMRVIRPGYIIGSPNKGLANTRDYIWRLVAGAVDAGIRSSGHDDEWMFVCDVEQVAQRVVNSSGILFPPMKSTEDSHVTTIMDGIYLRDLWELLHQELQCHLDPLDSSEWWSRLRNVVEQQGDGHPLWPLHFLLNQDQGAFTCNWKSTTSDNNKFLVTKAIQKNVSYLKQIGFLLCT